MTPETHLHQEELQLFNGENQIDESSSVSQHQITRETTTQSETILNSGLPPKIQIQDKQGENYSPSLFVKLILNQLTIGHTISPNSTHPKLIVPNFTINVPIHTCEYTLRIYSKCTYVVGLSNKKLEITNIGIKSGIRTQNGFRLSATYFMHAKR
jgi:hypothetical protein